MRIPYLFSYSALFMLKDGKRPVTRAIHETGEVDIPELIAAEAPIAATWQAGVVRLPDEHRDFHVRTFRGECYEPCAQTHIRHNTIQEIVRELCGTVDKPGKLPDEASISHRLGTNRDNVSDRITKRIDRLILVDGVPYIRCSTPKLNLTVQDMARLTIVTKEMEYSGSLDAKGIDETLIVPLADYEAIVRRAAARLINFVPFVFNVEVLIPEAVDFDTKTEAIVRTVGQAIADNEGQLYHWPRKVAEEFIGVRSDYKRWFEDPDSVDVVSMLDRIYAVVTQHYGLYNQTLVASFLANYDKVQQYIPDLEISLAVGRNPAP